MPANLFLLPMLAGYLFVHISHRFRFRAQALDGYRLLIESAIAGALLLGISRVITMALERAFPLSIEYWRRVVVADESLTYLGTAIGSVVLGVLLPILDNRRPRLGICGRFWRSLLLARRMRPLRRIVRWTRSAYTDNRRAALDSEIHLHGNGLTRLLHDAATYGSLVSITLYSRKWYVGYVAEAVNLEPKEVCFRLLPMVSGYREKDTLQCVRQIYYRPVYEKAHKENGSLRRFVITLSLKDVHDAREFDESLYEEHFSRPETPLPEGASHSVGVPFG